jgi:hypothetical protein
VIADDGEIGLRLVQGDDGPAAFITGVQRCGSVWCCPVCTAVIRARRSMEIAAAATAHVANGGTLGMLTLTVRHDATMPLQDSIKALQGAWEALQQRRAWRGDRDNMVGLIASKEVTYGANGWHPHLHVLVLWAPDAGDRGPALETWAQQAWPELVARRLGKRPNHHGVHYLDLAADSAPYVVKIAQETARGDHKTSDVLPQLLDGLEDGEAGTAARWLEWCDTMKGRRMLVWSKGLRAQLLPDVDELTDDEIVQQDVDGTLVGTVARETFRRLVRRRLVPRLLERIEAGDLPSIVAPPPPTG